MELREYLAIFRKNWILILLSTLLVTGAAAVYSLTATPQYQAKTELFVSVRSGDASTGDLSQGSNFARQAVTSYVSVVTSSIVLDEVIKELDLDTTSTELAKQVEASSPTNTVLIDISYTDPDPEKAARVTNTIGTVFANVVSDELENSSDGSQARVQLQTIEPAQVPDAPVSPKVARNLTLGLLLGLFLGIGIAVLRAVLDTRIHSKADIAEVTNLPIIGTVGKDAESAKRPLIALDDPRNPLVESYRTLRTNLQYINIDSNDKKSIVITSAGPSEGKSTTAVNLAIVMADAGSRVLIIDADLRKPKVSKLLGIEGSNGLSDLLVGRLNLEDALQRWGRRQIFVLPAGRIPPNPSELLQSTAMSRLMDKLEGHFDFIIIDAPPVLVVTDAAILSKITGGAVVISAAGKTRKEELASALESLAAVNGKVLGIIPTMVPTRGPDSYSYGAYSYQSYGHTPTQGGEHPFPARTARVPEESQHVLGGN
ncbi:MAG: polysaccharide biosynthesis tyrosine autokinase [Ancrocorticia sp.]|nr:polysaccharide biosynthesis tyrosine autokinase [Ancrocorticia sp.]